LLFRQVDEPPAKTNSAISIKEKMEKKPEKSTKEKGGEEKGTEIKEKSAKKNKKKTNSKSARVLSNGDGE
jgi:hypothetical protein